MAPSSTRSARTLLAVVALCAASPGATTPAVDLRLRGWTAKIEPETLTVHAICDGEPQEILIAKGPAHAVTDLVQTSESVSWKIPELGLAVNFSVQETHLRVRFDAPGDSKIEWPRTGDDSQLSALILPEGEGLYIALKDEAWRRRLNDHCDAASGGLLMPFWSYQIGNRTLTYHILSDVRSELCMEDRQGRIGANLRHEFQARDGDVPYEIEIWFGGGSPISPALEYRDGLMRAGKLVPLTDKIRKNPEVAKLLGAVHMYVWGDGRKPEFVNDLVKLGVKEAWIGYDQDENSRQTLAGKDYVEAAKQAGYLVGPYDGFVNAQDPKTGDAASRWPRGLYQDGCIVDRAGHIVRGFAGRGCELSSEALERAEPTLRPMAKRVEKQLQDGANSYFVDVDAFGELYDDYSPAHPMTAFKDRANRLLRLQRVRDRGIVLGSEEGVAWSVPVLDFAHGALSVHNAALWPEMKNFGVWWPPDRPSFFFQPIEPSQEFRDAKYDPAFRIPLYEAAFHDSIVATDRWNVPMTKMPSLAGTRQLLELLYGVPSIWAMDRRQLRDARATLTRLLAFFEPLHRQIGTLALTSFEWLSNDRLVQRTRFGSHVTLIANFGKVPFEGIGSGCIRAHWVTQERDETFCYTADAAPQAPTRTKGHGKRARVQ